MSQSVDLRQASGQDPATWRALTVFAGYRFFLAAVLFFVFYLKLPPEFLGETDPKLYTSVSQLYLLTALILLLFTFKRWGVVATQIKLQLVIDIVALILIMHASGGLKTGLGSLLLVVVVAGGALIPGRLAAFIAAIATLAVLLEVSYSQFSGDDVTKYSQAGILGATFFITAWLAQWLSHKMQSSQVLAEERARDVANLAVLNQHIISRMQIGVLALDRHGKVTMFNQSASNLLGIERTFPGFNLKDTVPELAGQLLLWQHHNPQPFEPFQARADLPEIRATATKLDSGEILIYIENTSAMAQQAQQLKLASLGRLTASIAHEIRNPLGAISHAGELLAEHKQHDQTITKLTDIIHRHSLRVNNIIETVLQMSRRKTVKPTAVVLVPWLEKFIAEFCDIKGANEQEITLHTDSPLVKVFMDPEQLHQVMWNLLDNAWHYSDADTSLPRIEVKQAMSDNEIFIDVTDNGPGVTDQAREHLFEPFYSQRQGGTGLGLYLARELCQANGARLSYLADELQSSSFRISFPGEWQEYIE
ncbi:sensor histidine kinase [Methylophaga sp. OBS4]|uniref:sensor histidine kinase n=1 Tax=Methylophaga sp. OBS4 TaxID=2991935 RepID=UPI00225AA967|nr:ATP-binding protein [Methylophaga sp. OBS4]MCX4188305.1 ATP-binding protein [Methylophaga sp. OBS4]